jgi:hypothetical protein
VNEVFVPNALEALKLNSDLASQAKWDLDVAPLAGVCLSRVSPRAPVPDILHPPAVVKRFKIPRSYRIAGLAVVIAGLTWFAADKVIRDKQKELDGIKKELARLKPDVDRVKLKDTNTRFAAHWRKHERFPWHQLYVDLSKTRVHPEHLYVSGVTVEESGGVTITGRTKAPGHYESFREELKRLPYLRNITPGTFTGGQKGYEYTFSLTAQLMQEK